MKVVKASFQCVLVVDLREESVLCGKEASRCLFHVRSLKSRVNINCAICYHMKPQRCM